MFSELGELPQNSWPLHCYSKVFVLSLPKQPNFCGILGRSSDWYWVQWEFWQIDFSRYHKPPFGNPICWIPSWFQTAPALSTPSNHILRIVIRQISPSAFSSITSHPISPKHTFAQASQAWTYDTYLITPSSKYMARCESMYFINYQNVYVLWRETKGSDVPLWADKQMGEKQTKRSRNQAEGVTQTQSILRELSVESHGNKNNTPNSGLQLKDPSCLFSTSKTNPIIIPAAVGVDL